MRKLCGLIVLLLSGVAFGAGPIRIMPMGDSITYGVGVPGGYRTELATQLTAAGINFQFVGAGTDNPSAALAASGQTAYNGVPYFGTVQIRQSLFAAAPAVPLGPYGNPGYWLSGPGAATTPADVILLEVGTNDVGYWGESVSFAASNLSALIGDIVTAQPNADVIVAQITPRIDSPSANTLGQQYNALIPGIVSSFGVAGDHVSMVDMYDAINQTTDISADELHPSLSGYNKMGDVWASALVAVAIPEPAPIFMLAVVSLLLIRRRLT